MTRKNLIAVALTSAALILGAAVVLVSPARALTNCTVSAGNAALDAEEQQMLILINNYRAANGLNPLIADPNANRAAAWMSQDMAARAVTVLSHVDSSGREPGTRLTQCDAPWTRAGENIAAGNASAAATFEQWRISPPHNANMLDPRFTHAGIGRASNPASLYGWYWTLNLTVPAATTSTTSVAPTTTSTTSVAPTTTLVAPTTTSTTSVAPTTTLVAPTTTTLVLLPAPVVPPSVLPPLPPPVPPPPVLPPLPGATPLPPTGDTCTSLAGARTVMNANITAAEQLLSAFAGGPGLSPIIAHLEQARASINAQFDLARAHAGCAPGSGGGGVVAAATAS